MPKSFWAYRTSWRSTTVLTPYHLFYGKQVTLPIEVEIKTLRTVFQLGMDLSQAQHSLLEQLNELNELLLSSIERTSIVQQQWTKWHDQLIKTKYFKEGDWALLSDSRFKNFKGKLQTHWLGPYEIETIYDNGIVWIKTINGEGTLLMANGHRLRPYKKPLFKEAVIGNIAACWCTKDFDITISTYEEYIYIYIYI